ncbi:MAG: hypothetical protein QXW10_00415 [Candidatus Micrarchaeaceae archaeon]
MATNRSKDPNSANVVVMDRDGVVVDDINMEFDRRFRKGNSLIERAFKELTFLSLNLVPIRKPKFNSDELDPIAIDYMKRMQRQGKNIVVKTANRNIESKVEERALEKEGVHAEVRHAKMLGKLDAHNDSEKKLNEDNQMAAFAALIRTGGSDKSITLVKKDYNSVAGFFIKLLGKHSRLNYTGLDGLDD